MRQVVIVLRVTSHLILMIAAHLQRPLPSYINAPEQQEARRQMLADTGTWWLRQQIPHSKDLHTRSEPGRDSRKAILTSLFLSDLAASHGERPKEAEDPPSYSSHEFQGAARGGNKDSDAKQTVDDEAPIEKENQSLLGKVKVRAFDPSFSLLVCIPTNTFLH